MYAVRLDKLATGGIGKRPPYIVRGNAYPQSIATYATREEAQAMADKCPDTYGARVVEWPGGDGS